MKKNSYNILMFSLFSVYLQDIKAMTSTLVAKELHCSFEEGKRVDAFTGIGWAIAFYIMAEKKGYIYKITSPTKRVYVGQTRNIKRRISAYKRIDCKAQPKLYNSFKKHGVEKHKFEVIAVCDIEEMNKYELFYIDLYDSCNTHTGLNSVRNSNSPAHISKTARKNIGLSKIGTKKRGAKSKYHGVSYKENRNVFDCHIRVNGKQVYLGCFDDEISAAYAYDIAVLKYHNGGLQMNFNESERLKLKDRVHKRNGTAQTSKYIGVFYDKKYKSYRTSIRVNKKLIHLGSFSDEVSAAYAYDIYVIENNLQRKMNFSENQRISLKSSIGAKYKPKSKYIGVSYRGRDNKWRSYIRVDGKHIELKQSNTEIEAAKIYNDYVIKNNLNRKLNEIL